MAEEKDRLKLQKEIEDLRKEIAEARRDRAKAEKERIEALVGDGQTKPLEGKTTVDEKVVLPSQILGYESASRVAVKISEIIEKKSPTTETILIYSEERLGEITQYHALIARIEHLTSRYQDLIGRASVEPAAVIAAVSPTLAPAALAVLLSSTLDVIGLFRTETTVNGTAFTIAHEAWSKRVLESSIRPTSFPSRL